MIHGPYSIKLQYISFIALLTTAVVTKCRRRYLTSLRGLALKTYLLLGCKNSEVFKVFIEVLASLFKNGKWGSVLKLFEHDISLLLFSPSTI